MVDEGTAGDVAVARYHLEEMLRQARLQGECGQAQGRQRGGLGGLEDDRVARCERREGPPGGDGHREVPGGDDADHAERFLEGDVPAAGYGDLLAEEAFGAARGVQQEVAGVAGLPAGVAEDMAGLADLQLRQYLHVRVDHVGEAAQQAGPVGGGG